MLCRKKLGDVMTLHRGYDLPEENRVCGNVPVISSSGITGWHNVSKSEGPNVVTGRYGTIGKVFYCEGSCWPLNTALYVSDFKGNSVRYVAYLLESSIKSDGKDKSTVPGIDRNVLHDLPVCYYSDPKEQEQVIAPLTLIDKTISLNKRLNDNLLMAA